MLEGDEDELPIHSFWMPEPLQDLVALVIYAGLFTWFLGCGDDLEQCALPYIQWLPIITFLLAQVLYFGFLSKMPIREALGSLADNARQRPGVLALWAFVGLLVGSIAYLVGVLLPISIYYTCEVLFVGLSFAVTNVCGWVRKEGVGELRYVVLNHFAPAIINCSIYYGVVVWKYDRWWLYHFIFILPLLTHVHIVVGQIKGQQNPILKFNLEQELRVFIPYLLSLFAFGSIWMPNYLILHYVSV